MNALLELRKQMEVDFLKTKTYEEINDMFNQLNDKLKLAESEVKKLRLGAVNGSNLVKSDWSLRECFNQLRFDKNHHLGLGDIRLTIAQQEEICELVERFYHYR